MKIMLLECYLFVVLQGERAFYLSASSAPFESEAHNGMIVKRKERHPKIT